VTCLAWNAEGKAEGQARRDDATRKPPVFLRRQPRRAYGKTLVLWCAYNLSGYHYVSRWNFREDGCL